MNTKEQQASDIEFSAESEKIKKLGYSEAASFLEGLWQDLGDEGKKNSFLAELRLLTSHLEDVKGFYDRGTSPPLGTKDQAQESIQKHLPDSQPEFLGQGDFSIVFKVGNDVYKYIRNPLNYLYAMYSRLAGDKDFPGERHTGYWAKMIGNDKLILRIEDVPGQRLEKAELALPLDKVFSVARDNGDDELITLLKDARRANPLFSGGFIEANEELKEDSFGLVMREEGEASEPVVYVVALDLDYLNNLTNPENKQGGVDGLKKAVESARPIGIPLERIRRTFPNFPSSS